MDESTQDMTADSPASGFPTPGTLDGALANSDLIALAAARDEAALWQTRFSYMQEQFQRSDEMRRDLLERVLLIEAQIGGLEAHAAALQTRTDQAEALVDAMQTAASAPRLLAASVPAPAIVDIADTLPHGADVTNRYTRRPLACIERLVLHHSGPGIATPQQMAEQHITDPKRQWPGIGFHYFIAADGTIYQTNHLETACYHVAHHNGDTAGIVLAGDFGEAMPSAGQLAATAKLLAWILQELRLPDAAVCGHSELADQPADCPGPHWLGDGGWKQALLQEIEKVRQTPRRPLYHYLLFRQTETDWPEDDWKAAARYISRFRPAVGFAAQEAALAENVTIVGGTDGVPAAVEDMLRSEGCRVQRIAGRNATQTRALLDAMARDGQRFLTS